MEKISKSKYFLVFGVVLIVAVAFYLFGLDRPNQTPYKVLAPDSYDLGTTVSLYRAAPPGFPADIILENKVLTDSSVVTSRQGVTQTKVSYKSRKNVADALALYKEVLPTKGWSISAASASANVATFTASKGTDRVLVTIAVIKQVGTAKEIGALVTFQYDK